MVIAIVDYGVGNLANVARALRRAGAEDVRVSRDPALITSARGVVLPGVGHFGDCAAKLHGLGLDEPVRHVRAAGIPLLGLCVGMQLFFEGSEEDPAAPGLAFYRGTVRRLRGDARVPHTGWNDVRIERHHAWLDGVPDGAHFYFVHSYAPDPAEDVVVGRSVHGAASFPAIVGSERMLGVQFHPEKSGAMGERLLAAFVRGVER